MAAGRLQLSIAEFATCVRQQPGVKAWICLLAAHAQILPGHACAWMLCPALWAAPCAGRLLALSHWSLRPAAHDKQPQLKHWAYEDDITENGEADMGSACKTGRLVAPCVRGGDGQRRLDTVSDWEMLVGMKHTSQDWQPGYWLWLLLHSAAAWPIPGRIPGAACRSRTPGMSTQQHLEQSAPGRQGRHCCSTHLRR